MRRVTRSVVRKLGRMRWRALAIVLVVAMAMAMFVSGLYGGAVLDSSTASFFKSSRMPDIFVGLPGPANASAAAAALDGAPGIDSYALRLKGTGSYAHSNETVQVTLIGMGDPAHMALDRLTLVSGRFFAAGGEAVAIDGLGGKGIRAGAAIAVEVAGHRLALNLTGIVRSPEYVFPSAYADVGLPTPGTLVVIFMPLTDLEAVLGPGVNDIVVLLRPGADRRPVVDSLGPLSPASIVYRESHPSVVFMGLASAKTKNLLPVIGVIFLFVGFVSVFMTMMRLVATDSRSIGVLMSLGYGRADILRGYLAMGLVLALVGGALGSVLAFLLTYGAVSVSVSLFLSIAVTFPLDVWPFLEGAALVAGAVLLSVLVPVVLITRSPVREALEYRPRGTLRTTPVGSRGRSRLARMGLRNTARDPGRTALTVLVVAVAIGTSGMWLVLSQSAIGYITEQVDADTWDLRATFGAPVPAPGVNASYLGLGQADARFVVPFTALTAEAQLGSRHAGAFVTACDQMATVRRFTAREGRMDFTGAVLSSKLADDLGARPGDSVVVTIGPRVATIRVSGVAQEALASALYTERTNLAPLFPEANCTGAFVALAAGAPVAARAADMRSLPNVADVRVRSDITANLQTLLAQARAFFYFFLLLSVIITIVVAGSAVIISTMERDVEFATLDTLGFSRWHSAGVVLVEMCVLGLLAAAVGIPMAYLLAELLAGVLASVLFYFPVVLLAGATVTTFVVGLASVLLSSAMPIRYEWGLDTEATLRERTAG